MTNSNTNIDASNTDAQIFAQRAMTKSQSIKTRSDSSWWDQRLAPSNQAKHTAVAPIALFDFNPFVAKGLFRK
jgi:hypothetical protein